jgi:hypothetical protein
VGSDGTKIGGDVLLRSFAAESTAGIASVIPRVQPTSMTGVFSVFWEDALGISRSEVTCAP